MRLHIKQGAAWIKNGGVIAYPTEAVYGLGCDPLDQAAVHHLLSIKQRDESMGLILISDTFRRIEAFLEPLVDSQRALLQKTWPGPVTWLIPAQSWVPKWLTGANNTIAVRVTAHPIASALCQAADMPIVSTSANIHGRRPAKTTLQVHRQFDQTLDYIVPGKTGKLDKPTMILDLVSNTVLRPS